jgi:hypothetical protein
MKKKKRNSKLILQRKRLEKENSLKKSFNDRLNELDHKFTLWEKIKLFFKF